MNLFGCSTLVNLESSLPLSHFDNEMLLTHLETFLLEKFQFWFHRECVKP